MIRVFKKDVVTALNESQLYSSSFVRKNENEKSTVKDVKTCLVGDVLRRSKSFSNMEDFQEYCRDIKHPLYEQAFRAMFREDHKHIQKLNLKESFTPIQYNELEHRSLVIDYLKEKNLFLSLISAEFEYLMETVEFNTPAPDSIKRQVLDFIQVNVPELIKES